MEKASEEKEIRTLIDQWSETIKTCDVTKIMAFYADPLTAFDALGALRFNSIAAYRDHWNFCMQYCRPPMTFDLAELVVTAEGKTGFAHFLVHSGAEDNEGNRHAMWMRGTGCYRKIDGQWKIVHEHFSTPFDPESGKAIFDAQP